MLFQRLVAFALVLCGAIPVVAAFAPINSGARISQNRYPSLLFEQSNNKNNNSNTVKRHDDIPYFNASRQPSWV